MFETLTRGFTSAREKLGGVRELNDENVDQSLRDVRMSLLEADVDLAILYNQPPSAELRVEISKFNV